MPPLVQPVSASLVPASRPTRSGSGAPVFTSDLRDQQFGCEHTEPLRRVTGLPGLGLLCPDGHIVALTAAVAAAEAQLVRSTHRRLDRLLGRRRVRAVGYAFGVVQRGGCRRGAFVWVTDRRFGHLLGMGPVRATGISWGVVHQSVCRPLPLVWDRYRRFGDVLGVERVRPDGRSRRVHSGVRRRTTRMRATNRRNHCMLGTKRGR